LEDVVEGKHLGVEVADGHIIKCPATGKIKIEMLDDDGNTLEVKLHDVMYVPGVSRRLFSITRFIHHGHHATFTKGTTVLQFTPSKATVSIAHATKAAVFAADSTVTNNGSANYHEVPAFRSSANRSRQKRLPLELLHARLGHRKCRTLLSANEHQLWKDVSIRMSPETGCLSCGIATARSAACNTEHHSGASRPGKYIFLDIEHPITTAGLTTATTYPFYLIVVDAYSRYVHFYGLPNKSTKAVATALQQYQADNKPAETFGFISLEKIRADAGTQFTSSKFANHCRAQGIHLSLAAPKKQYQNHLTERTWQTTSTMARALLVHACLPDIFWYHALMYASYIFNVLPVRGVKNDQDYPSTPHELFFQEKPAIARFRVFGCPVVTRRWVTQQSSQGKQTEHGVRVLFIGFDANNKGYLVYCPGSRTIITSEDVTFDKDFSTAIATTWQQHKDALELRPSASTIPMITDTIEHTGDIDDCPELAPAKEGEDDRDDEADDNDNNDDDASAASFSHKVDDTDDSSFFEFIYSTIATTFIRQPTLIVPHVFLFQISATYLMPMLLTSSPGLILVSPKTKIWWKPAQQRHMPQLCPMLRMPIHGNQHLRQLGTSSRCLKVW